MTVLLLIWLTALCASVCATADTVVDVEGNSFSTNNNYKYNVRFTSDVHRAVKPLEAHHRSAESMNAKFRSLIPGRVDIWYDDGGEGVEQGHLNLGQETTTNSYETHEFFFTKGDKSNEVARVKMVKDQVLYLIEDPNNPAPVALRDEAYREFDYMAEYLERTGIQWRHYFGPNGPRPPPSLFMWPASQIGQVHSVTSTEGYWHCEGAAANCQLTAPVELELQVVSLKPRAFIIEHFFSDFEASEILKLAIPRMSKSIVGDGEAGAFESNTRTSRNGWLKREDSYVIESLFRRAEHLLRIERLDRRNTEDIQVVHYKDGQKYDSHHDWGVSGYPESRFITLLLYLSDMQDPTAGGETAFPKGADGKGFKVQPGKGSAVLFYNLLEDGNGDDLAVHAALPINKGEKWLANFWVWDPVRNKLSMTEVDKDFDLLAGHDLGESRNLTFNDEDDPEKMNVLVWHKLDTIGFQPSAREGHTAVTNGLSVLVFGGFEAGQRVNGLISLDVTSCSWSVVPTKGEVPPPRSFHAASRYQNLMIVHGGESKENGYKPAQGHVTFDMADPLAAELSKSIAEDSSRSVPYTQSQSTSVLLDQHDNSREHGKRPDTLQKLPPAAFGGHDGVTLGDSLCGTKLANQVKITRGNQPASAATSANITASSSGIALNTLEKSTTSAQAQSRSALPSALATTHAAVAAQQMVCCLDDLHVLDTISMEWYKMKCILSPLPRKGHTLNIVPLKGVQSAVIFGGYSIENVTLSNSLHVCEADAIYEHYISKRDMNYRKNSEKQNTSHHVGVVKSLKQDQIEPLMWRTLSTTGAPPKPRYRHSSTLIYTENNTVPMLVIMGGIGTDATVALNDLYILDLNTLHWTMPLTGNDALTQNIGGDGPAAGLYGHVAFSVAAMAESSESSVKSAKKQNFELLVFGGSANPNSGQSNCNQSIFAYNMETHIWRRVPTGFVFPSGRANHSAALVQGWAPLHDTPGAAVGELSSTTGLTTTNTATTKRSLRMSNGIPPASSSSGVCAVIFGGLDSIQCASDTWALDLKWRKSGVEQYDASVSAQEAHMLQQPHITTSSVEYSYLNTPGLMGREANTTLRNLVDFNGTTATLARTNSALDNFRKVPLDSTFDAADGVANTNNDRHRKQGINSRKYADIANTATTFSGKEFAKSLKGTKTSSQPQQQTQSKVPGSSMERMRSQSETELLNAQRLSPNSRRSDRAGDSLAHSGLFNNTMEPQTPEEFANYAINSRDYKLPGSVNEQLEIGSAFLKVRKERAQTELALQREREKCATAETVITTQGTEISTLQQTLLSLQEKYDADTEALREQLRQSVGREAHLRELNDEAYLLLTMHGVKKL